ncbi:MAG: response regulator transcription factor [Dorea sp.]|nr:response regulator transcription factor [Dorea sp.]
MFKIAVIDDSKEMTEVVREIAKRQAEESGIESEIMIKTYTDPEAFLDDLKEGRYFHIFILDVEMPEMTGVELADNIRELQKDGYIIFLTCHPEFAIQGFERDVFQYILKSDMEFRLPAVLEQVFEICVREHTEYYLIANRHRMEKIRCGDIIYVKKEGKNCILYTEGEEHYDRKTMDQVRRFLEPIGFICIDRGRIVNIEHILKIEKNEVYMDNDAVLEISRANIKKVKEQVTEYWGECI